VVAGLLADEEYDLGLLLTLCHKRHLQSNPRNGPGTGVETRILPNLAGLGTAARKKG
jgi:hypothetical protein